MEIALDGDNSVILWLNKQSIPWLYPLKKGIPHIDSSYRSQWQDPTGLVEVKYNYATDLLKRYGALEALGYTVDQPIFYNGQTKPIYLYFNAFYRDKDDLVLILEIDHLYQEHYQQIVIRFKNPLFFLVMNERDARTYPKNPEGVTFVSDVLCLIEGSKRKDTIAQQESINSNELLHFWIDDAEEVFEIITKIEPTIEIRAEVAYFTKPPISIP